MAKINPIRNINDFQTSIQGLHRGRVVDVRDPYQRGRARVYCYGFHGDLDGLNIDALPWAEVALPQRGANCPPELDDRVVVGFENADPDHPIILGYWKAIPAGRGKFPSSAATGTEIRPEGWHSRDNYPEGQIVASSGAGNTIWFEDKYVGSTFASVMQQENTSGRVFKMRSFHLNAKPYATQDTFPSGTGALLQMSKVGPNTPLRDGTTPQTDPVSGAVEWGDQSTYHKMMSDAQDFSLDIMDQGDIDIVSHSGNMQRIRQGSDSILLNGGVSITGPSIALQMTQCPKRWDG
jgi:hypothetical protein